MLASLFRILFGFIVACLVAGVVKVLFVMTPAQLSTLPEDVAADRVAAGGLWALAIATHSAIFSAPFAAVAVLVAEWQRLRDWTYYALVGIALAMLGFYVQYNSESGTAPSIVNEYAFIAFLTAGFAAGFAYWMAAGRRAGGRRRDRDHVLRRREAAQIATKSEPVTVKETADAAKSKDRESIAPTGGTSAAAAT
jgi:hypothetical protein